jgi:hypothetical protein
VPDDVRRANLPAEPRAPKIMDRRMERSRRIVQLPDPAAELVHGIVRPRGRVYDNLAALLIEPLPTTRGAQRSNVVQMAEQRVHGRRPGISRMTVSPCRMTAVLPPLQGMSDRLSWSCVKAKPSPTGDGLVPQAAFFNRPSCVRAVTPSSRPTSSTILPFCTRSTAMPVKCILRPVAPGSDPTRKSLKAGPVWVPPPSHRPMM